HDLADPDAIRIAILSPRERSLILIEPGQKSLGQALERIRRAVGGLPSQADPSKTCSSKAPVRALTKSASWTSYTWRESPWPQCSLKSPVPRSSFRDRVAPSCPPDQSRAC